MSEGFLGEIRMTAFNFAPKGYALCNGQLLPVNQNQALFSLLGTAYGGNGQTTFGLPNFQGCTPVHIGSGLILGQGGGEANHTLSIAEIPPHTHAASAATSGSTGVPANNLLAGIGNLYGGASNLVPTNASTISTVGTSQPHQNMQPYCTISLCICLQGIFPVRP